MGWSVLNCSVTGASHKRRGVSCQDYSLCSLPENGETPIIMCVSDGHGGSRYVRSAQGAVYACEAASSAIGAYINQFLDWQSSVVKQLVESRLKLDIVKKWQSLCLSHARQNPFDEQELSAVNISREECESAISSDDPLEREKVLAAYGATLIVVILLKNAIITMQLGDGDVLFYYEGEGVICPIDKDESLIANETTSLCSAKAPFYFRHNVTHLYERKPNLIMIATDGYPNSFNTVDDYHKAPEDFHKIYQEEGAAYIAENLPIWLDETSLIGSGDDVTLVLAFASNQ